MTVAETQSAIKSAMSVARDVAEGRIAPAQLAAAAVAECRALFGVVAGVEDPLWALQVDVARQVLAAGGIPVGELAEWLAVAKTRESAGLPSNTDVDSDPPASTQTHEQVFDGVAVPAGGLTTVAIVDTGALAGHPPLDAVTITPDLGPVVQAMVTVYPPGAPLPPGSVVDVGAETWSDEPMHTLSDDCPCGPTVVTVPAGHRERQHGDPPAEYDDGGVLPAGGYIGEPMLVRPPRCVCVQVAGDSGACPVHNAPAQGASV